MTSGWRVYTDTHSQAYFFSEISLSDTHVTHSAHFSTFTHQGRIERSFHQTIRRWLVVLECDGDHFHFHELTPLHLRNKSRCRLAALHHTNTGNEHPVNTVNSEMDTSRARFVPVEDLTHDDDGTNSHMSDIPLQLPASAHFPSNITALVTFSQAWSDLVQHCSQSPTDTQLDWSESLAMTVSCYVSSKCTCSSWTSRSFSVGCATSTRSSVWSARNGSTFSTPATGRISCCNSSIWSGCEEKPYQYLARNNESHNYSVQMQVRQLEHEMRDFSKDKGNCYRDFSQEANQALENQRENLGSGSDNRSMELRRTSTWFTYRTQFSCTKQQFSTTRWTTSALDRIGSRNAAVSREMLEESRAGRSATGPEIGRLRQWQEELLRLNDRANIDALLSRNRTKLESHESRTPEVEQIIRELPSEVVRMKASAVPPNLTRDLQAKIESRKYEIQPSKDSTDNTGLPEQLGWRQPRFDSRCLCWW